MSKDKDKENEDKIRKLEEELGWRDDSMYTENLELQHASKHLNDDINSIKDDWNFASFSIEPKNVVSLNGIINSQQPVRSENELIEFLKDVQAITNLTKTTPNTDEIIDLNYFIEPLNELLTKYGLDTVNPIAEPEQNIDTDITPHNDELTITQTTPKTQPSQPKPVSQQSTSQKSTIDEQDLNKKILGVLKVKKDFFEAELNSKTERANTHRDTLNKKTLDNIKKFPEQKELFSALRTMNLNSAQGLQELASNKSFFNNLPTETINQLQSTLLKDAKNIIRKKQAKLGKNPIALRISPKKMTELTRLKKLRRSLENVSTRCTAELDNRAKSQTNGPERS